MSTTTSYDLSLNDNDLFVPRPNEFVFKTLLNYSANKVWNNLPLIINNCRNVQLFKKQYYFQIISQIICFQSFMVRKLILNQNFIKYCHLYDLMI